MRDVIQKVRIFRLAVGFLAAVAIACLLLESGYAPLDPRTIASALVAGLSLISAFGAPRPSRGALAALRARGKALRLDKLGLTERERELVYEYLSGKSMAEIARRHGLSPSTVRNAFSSVYAKLDIKGITGLIALLARRQDE